MAFARRGFLKSSTAAIVGAALTSCGGPDNEDLPLDASAQANPSDAATKEAEDLLQSATNFMLQSYPESASNYGVDVGANAALKSKLSDHSAAGQSAIAGNAASLLAKIEAVDASLLPADQALTLDVVATVLRTTKAGFAFPHGDVALLNSYWSYRNSPYTVAQNTGAFVDIPMFMGSAHTIETADDAEAYLARMEGFAGQLDGENERIRADAAQGIVLPDFLMAKTTSMIAAQLARDPAQWGITRSVIDRAADIQGTWAARAQAIAADIIRPAAQRQLETLEALKGKAASDAGIGARPNGDEYYAWALKAGTTTDMTPDEVHDMGLEQLADLQGQMDPILRAQGYSKGSIGDRMNALAQDPRFQFSGGDEGRAEIRAYIDEALAGIRARLPDAFETQVPGFLEVTRIPQEVEAGAPNAYGGPGSIDGKQPGHFWINLRTPALHSKYSLPDLTYHEAIPGHVWQGEYTFKQPLIRTLLGFNAYSEGWALYAEQLADELGLYDDFPVGRLGYLQSLAFRACRLVVDTGLHAKGWSREQGVEFFVERNGSNPQEVASEVDRYCAWPGQACGYKVGHSAINMLRDKAKSQLGDSYDFRRFNDAILLGGSVPMTVLEDVIDRHIAATKSA